jgi:hypothetical protein
VNLNVMYFRGHDRWELCLHSSVWLFGLMLEHRGNLIFRPIPWIMLGSRDSIVGIASGYGLDDRGVGVRVPVGSRIFSSPSRPHRL